MKYRAFLLLGLVLSSMASAFGQRGGELTFCLRTEPRTFNPILVQDAASEAIRYLTGGVLVRLNRRTQQLEPELATSWKLDQSGRQITFTVRRGILFSDGTPFTAADVAYTMNTMMDPNVHSPTADAFRAAPGDVRAT